MLVDIGMKRRIEVVDYDRSWPILFDEEMRRLARVFHHTMVGIHHIGSTAVPGLAAKPTIDILIEVKDGTHIPQYYHHMRQLGYESRGECLDASIPGTPGRYYFPKVVDSHHVVHVHVCHEDHSQVEELLALRDYLRSHRKEAAKYGALKRKIAVECTDDNVEYMEGKSLLVKTLIEKAMLWRAQPESSAICVGSTDKVSQ